MVPEKSATLSSLCAWSCLLRELILRFPKGVKLSGRPAIRRLQKSLLEQLQINDLEISQRFDLLGLTREDLTRLSTLQEKICALIDAIVDEFYMHQTEIDEVTLLIGDSETMARLKRAQHDYILDLFSGQYDTDYVNNRLRIGMVHKRIGVEPKLYLAAIRSLKEILARLIRALVQDPLEARETVDTLDKLIYFDTTLVFDTYIQGLISEIDSARKRTELYAQGLEQKVAERTQQLEELARKDPLTGLFNKGALSEVLEREIAAARRRKSSLSCAYFDVDDFKTINDTKGHQFGDMVIKAVGTAIIENIRDIDIGCRYGGDEFCIFFPDCEPSGAEAVCKRIIKAFNEKFPKMTLSIGVSQYDDDNVFSAQALISEADAKMYESKEISGSHISL